ncbi:MAG: copper resistance protein B [Gemmatimonadetes bacterium]|nr:copper resistance protein B [Gemmatimonadota bacterium]
MAASPKRRWAVCTTAALGLALAHALPTAAQLSDQTKYLFLMARELERASGLEGQPLHLDAKGWYGGDYTRLWVKIRGNVATDSRAGDVQVQALFSRLVAPYWELQVGLRVDRVWGDVDKTRTHLAIGLEGLAPYWFEVEATLFVTSGGDVSTQLTGTYDLLVTQRMILESQIDLNASLQEVPELGLGSGVTDLELGFRLRYEIRREFAPYVGLVWRKAFAGTADFARLAGTRVRDGTFVAGVRVWY